MHVLDASSHDLARWQELARRDPLAILIDLDGTLVDFAPTPEQAIWDPEVPRVLTTLASTGARVVIVSGRPRAAIEPLLAQVPAAWWAAEHGAWIRFGTEWIGPTAACAELDELEATVAALTAVPGARHERKSLSVCIHWRMVAPAHQPALIAAAELACEEWLEAHPAFEHLPGLEMMEVRLRNVHKGRAVARVREAIAGVHLIALGDDVTDEDMFAELSADEGAIAVGERARQTRAHAALSGPIAVRTFLRWLVEVRTGTTAMVPPLSPILVPRTTTARRALLVMSNRMPMTTTGRRRAVGGLVAALEPALQDRDAIWLGWSGHERDGATHVAVDLQAQPAHASFDLPSSLRDKFYAGFCNSSLWPLLHGFPGRLRYDNTEWDAYVTANELFARNALELVRPDGMVWVHDYHLLLVARALRRLGHRGRIGMFLHVPVPPRELLETIPWRAELLEAMLDFDLIGVHTERFAANLIAAAGDLEGARVDGHTILHRGRACAVGVFPIEIDPAPFLGASEECAELAGLRASLGERRLLLGVDRLDYSKGIPERLAGFERLLEHYPAWRGAVSFVQVSVPSREEIPDYADLKHRVETMVGRINGRFGEADWTPVRYLYRSYAHDALAQLYRIADVALVTPLRDGMNLVAKEYVVAQELERPGVLVLSRFAGAADQLRDAVLTNPYHADGLAADIDRALRMPPDERRARHARLVEAIRQGGTAATWAASFLNRLKEPGHEPALLPRASWRDEVVPTSVQLVDQQADHRLTLRDRGVVGLGQRAPHGPLDRPLALAIDARALGGQLEPGPPPIVGIDQSRQQQLPLEPREDAGQGARVDAEGRREPARADPRRLADQPDHQALRPGDPERARHPLGRDLHRVREAPQLLHELERLAAGDQAGIVTRDSRHGGPQRYLIPRHNDSSWRAPSLDAQRSEARTARRAEW